MLILFYDTETQHMPLFREPSGDPRQPHIVQLAAKLIDSDTRECHAAIDLIVRPDGWEIPEDTVKIHGITTEHALRVGVPEESALMMLLTLEEVADVRIGHNESFDARIVRIAIKRYMPEPDILTDGDHSDDWKARDSACTMMRSTPICQLPNLKGSAKYKWPRLEEAYRFFTWKTLEGAHNAMNDVDATIAVWFAMDDLEAKDD